MSAVEIISGIEMMIMIKKGQIDIKRSTPLAQWSFRDFVESFLKLSLSGLSSVRSL